MKYKNFSILPTSLLDEDFYKKCYSHEEWRVNYTSSFVNITGDFSEFIKEHPFVKRFVIKDGKQSVGFFNVSRKGKLKDSSCLLSGGILPKKMDTGLGVKLTAIAIDYVFNTLGYNKAICKTLERNTRNIKLLKALGLRQEGYMIEEEYDEYMNQYVNMYYFAYLKKDFPHSLSKKILAKYEKK